MNVMYGAVVAASGLALGAPEAGVAGAPQSAAHELSIWELISNGGWMMFPIGLCSLIGLAIVAERLISLRRPNVIPAGFLPGLRAALGADADATRAIDYCKRNPSPVANVFGVALKRRHEPLDLLERHVSEAGEREVQKLRKRVRALAVIAAISPLMGLLGTVFGMIKVFQKIAISSSALGRTEVMAAGIYEAMVSTAGGLIIAIPAVVCYHAIASKIERLVVEIDAMTMDFIETDVHASAQMRATASAEAKEARSVERKAAAPAALAAAASVNHTGIVLEEPSPAAV